MELSNSVVLVTGASSGIGAATARAASRAGARVVLAARRQDRVRRLAAGLGDALAVGCDVTDAGQVADAVRAATEKFGRLDVLVNSAGQGLTAPVEETGPADFRAILDLNLTAPLITMQAVLPVMRAQGGGAIVNVSSGTVFSVLPLSGAYAASKQGLAVLSATARLELAGTGIVVSTFYPFVTSTEFAGSVKAGKEAAAQMMSDGGLKAQPPELAADAIIDLIRSGAEQADMVPQQFGGTRSMALVISPSGRSMYCPEQDDPRPRSSAAGQGWSPTRAIARVSGTPSISRLVIVAARAPRVPFDRSLSAMANTTP